ncbi:MULTISPECIES: hypothetical protein [unclassified Mesorhizobium]|uniref:hypothetical protein n=1 Tax=unclassified Mesorhizobium TaxID=325217 RepID=UPI003337A791
MIKRTENAVAVVNTALSPAIKPPKGRRVMVGPAIGPASNTLMGLQSVSRDGDAGIQTNGKTYVVAPRRRPDPSISPRWNAPVYIRRRERAGQILANPVGTGAPNVREGAQWLWPIFAANKQPSGKTL